MPSVCDAARSKRSLVGGYLLIKKLWVKKIRHLNISMTEELTAAELYQRNH